MVKKKRPGAGGQASYLGALTAAEVGDDVATC